jgi:2'-5' RNA ligase
MVRCFVAIECNNPDVKNEITIVQRALESTGAKIKSVESENLHITLKFLGEIMQHKLDEAIKIVNNIYFTPFKAKIEEVGVFPNLRRPATIWAGVTEGVSDVTIIFDELDLKLSKIGFERERRRFHPHLTICRIRSGTNRAQLIDELLMVKDQVFGEIEVDKVVLKKSVLTPSGPIYTTLAESRYS